MYKIIRFFLFLLPAEFAHHFTMTMLKYLHRLQLLPLIIGKINTDAPRKIFGLEFKNPIGIAAGLDKNGDYIDCLAALGVGFIEVGAVTPKAQPGNPKPRLFRLTAHQALINRFGFNNKGVDYLVQRLQKRRSHCVIGVNLGKNKDTPLENASQDYLVCLEKIYPYADFATINISSPNTPGLRELQQADYLHNLLQAVKNKRDDLHTIHRKYLPILVKLSPDETKENLLAMLKTALDVGIDGIIATNTTQQREQLRMSAYAQETGGLSGMPLRDLSFKALVTLCTAPRTLDIISVGGIDSESEASRRFQYGAKLLQVYTSLIYQGPKIIENCIRASQDWNQAQSKARH